jgi:hypothetical protein
MATKAKKLAKYGDFQEILSKELPINAARVKFIVLLITSLLKVQSVNFERLAQGIDNEVDLGSNLRRIQRFFASFQLDGDLVARLLFKLLPISGPLRLSLDRTNWKFGQRNINILAIGVIYKGLSLPILWSFLGDKRGNSSQKERIDLVKRFIRLFGVESIESITADREFVGKDWWNFLIDQKIRFFIRLRANMYVKLPRKGEIKASWMFQSLPLNTFYQHDKIVQIGGCEVYISGMKFVNQKGQLEFLIIASFDKTPDILEFYKERWQIETMFKAFKTAGFNLESTHLTDYERLDRLLMIVSLAFLWAYKTGIYREKTFKPIKIKKHGRPAKSIFSYGLDWLAQVLINGFTKLIETLSAAFLSCT